MKKNKTNYDNILKTSTQKETIQDFLQQEQRRLDNQRRKDSRYLAKMPLIEGIGGALLLSGDEAYRFIEDDILQLLEVQWLYLALKQLKPRDREVLFLRFFCGWKLKQIAALYGISQSAVSQRIHKNLRNLQKNFFKNT